MTDPKARPGPFDYLPAFEPLPSNLPPQMASALIALRKALADPPSMGDKFPFVMPATVTAQTGRPSKVQPNQVVRLCRFIRLGDSMRAGAKKAGLKDSTARDIFKGQCAVAHHPAVLAAGVELPAWVRGKPHGKFLTAPAAPQTDPARVDAPSPLSSAPAAAFAEAGAGGGN